MKNLYAIFAVIAALVVSLAGCGAQTPTTPTTSGPTVLNLTGTTTVLATIAASTATTGLWDMTTDGTNLFISEENNVAGGNGNIIKMNASTGAFTRITIAIANAKPDGIAIAPNGDLYVSDKKNSAIYKIAAPYTGGATVLPIPAGTFSVYSAITLLGGIDGIATDGTSLYVADIGTTATTGKIIKIDIANPATTAVLTTGLSKPWDVCLNGGNLYVSEATSIGRLNISTGVYTAGIVTGLARPDSLTTDGTNLYISEANKNRVVKAPIGGGAFTPVATGFSVPDGLAIIGASLFVADNGNYQVKKVQ